MTSPRFLGILRVIVIEFENYLPFYNIHICVDKWDSKYLCFIMSLKPIQGFYQVYLHNIGYQAFQVPLLGCMSIHIASIYTVYIYIWVNYNDLTATSLGMMVSKGNHPNMALIQVSEML